MSNMQLDTLRRIVQEINASVSLHESLDIMVNHVAEAMHVDVCSIYLLDERNRRYVLMASKGLKPEAVGNVSLNVGEGLVGLVGQREEIVNLDNAPKHERFAYLPETGEELYNSFLGVPVMYRRKVMGVLVVQNKESQDFSEAAESFLVTLCAQLSGVIAHAHAVGNIDVFRKPSNGSTYKTFQGVSGAGGIALGRAIVLYPPADLTAIPDREAEDISDELELLDQAIASVRLEIQSLDEKMQDSLMSEERALFSVFLRMLDENVLPSEIKEHIRAGSWAQGAVRKVIDKHIALFAQMEDDYLRERVSDLKDLGRRILACLQEADSSHRELSPDSILIGEEISTAALVELPVDNIAAIVTSEGAANSHMVIVARALGIPTVVGVTELPITTLDDIEMIVDAYQGRVFVNPPRRLRQRYKEVQKEEEQIAKDLKQYETKDAVTPDGVAIPLFVNTGLMIDVVRGVQRGAKGVGLYRSEIPFMLRERFPGEEEQRAIYRQQLSHFANKPVIMRTLDIGADKDLPYFSIEEENSALGWRGLRFTLDHPEIFSAQIRAMLKASIGLNNLHILLPMVTSVSEVEEVLYLLERDWIAVQEEEQVKITRPKIGIMVEVPSVLLQVGEFAELVDFFSVGSNDLTQYLLAVDRNNPHVANVYSHFHPSVLRALKRLVEECHIHEKPVSVCGEMAGDPLSAILLMAMGFNTLSMSSSNILRVRKAICHVPMTDAQRLLDDVLQMNNPLVVKSWLEHYFKTHGLGDMVKSNRLVGA
ncbi:phosphoenolpyruvate--protein phosphotransferase [Acinetobacter venetianus]|jgi:phosphotransferase system, enzyme I, PtsP|uniref:phosphoenolpyruvate--protein phosphotransferase n=4 Tax=Acinetobacter venetianus TaxID=52133 RepID=N8YQ05_ACIVR|nr:phosphoenolpyruvate--protein phosphotransferase [Acinetobacter venetianus]ENV38801.1 phosphoenolpyruvate-protein phosphotransferase [Acinetobacter venetianus RAG-1 = CIP 110063]KXO86525.1 phosphoenolpyruvate--protein phosphotransferase [Acinetobacter venetianus]KXZ71837.1 Phosphoenolpyruvate-protein phosphotransferase [Acinetobacter venetianus]MCR4531810.1 phosphoenolpyruvate--protein phosphotransferase [Acinetobacter venetianus]QNH50895.1 phosphoenolpyruvate--protein phosphotransferase [Ac